MKVLLIDDDLDIRRIGRFALSRSHKMNVILAASGDEGVALARDEQPDVILLDVNMPETSGPEIFTKLREDSSTRSIPVIFLTGRKSEPRFQREIEALGAAGLIMKPFNANALGDRIVEIIKRKEINTRLPVNIADLRDDFLLGATTRLRDIERDLDRLAVELSNRELLSELMRNFHKLAGSGSTYGFPRVSVLGQQGEQDCSIYFDENVDPDTSDLDRWRALVVMIREELAEGQAMPSLMESGRRGPLQVFVIDEDDHIFLSLLRRFDADEVAVHLLNSIPEALERFRGRAPDGVVVGARVGDGNGAHLAAEVRRMSNGEDAAVVLFGDDVDFVDKVEIIRSGADAYFERPVELEQVGSRLEGLLARRRRATPRVLSVEDDPDQAAFLMAVLESAGYHVRVCQDPKLFEADLIAFRPDIVLMDVLLPEISGFTLARFLRSQELFADVPLLFLTTEGQVRDHLEGLKAGGDDYLVKPVSPALLLSAVAARIERARVRKQASDRDGLTGALTHAAFRRYADAVIAEKQRSDSLSAILFLLEVSALDEINAVSGFRGGDRVLVQIARLMRQRLRPTDVVARIGGDKFAAVVTNVDKSEGLRLAERFVHEVGKMQIEGVSAPIVARAAVAELSKAESLRDWLVAANAALRDGRQSAGLVFAA